MFPGVTVFGFIPGSGTEEVSPLETNGVSVTAQRSRWRLMAALAFLFLLSHVFVSTCLPERLAPLSTLWIVLAEMGAFIAALRASGKVRSPARILWWLLASAILFHSTAMTLDAVTETLGTPVFNYVPGLSIFFSMLYGVPLLAAVSMQTDSRIARVARTTNAVLSLAVGVLLYVQIFSLLTLHGSMNSADAVLISHLFDGIDLFLAAAATVRWLGSDSTAERGFFRIAAIFLWINALLPAIHNRLLIRYDFVWLDLLISIPYLVLFVLIEADRPEPARPSRARVVHLVQSGSSIFLSVALLVLGVVAARTHFYLGLGAALLAILSYGVVSTLAQSRGRETEMSLERSKAILEGMVGVDNLTGIPNRWAFDATLDREFLTARRTKSPVSLMMIDVDNFKQLNDSRGHQTGDACLVRVAGALREALPRGTDFVARYGGEEFAAILPATDAAGAAEAAARTCRSVAGSGAADPGSPFGWVTVSIGIATYDGSPQKSAADLVRAADQALYDAKRRGRNRFESFDMNASNAIEA
ncbi:MAG TPA: GGDEF domain-containing protein [Acidobacteriaceae bacterium]